MAAQIIPSEDGYTIRGLLPPALRNAGDDEKLAFYGLVVAEGLKQKDRELSQGLDKDGRKLRRIGLFTRTHRRSAMTPTGKGDPSAPPLTPGRGLSRTRALLSGRAFPDRAEFWWRYDPFTFDSWARILRYQAEEGRDVFGLSPAGLKVVAARSWDAFARRREQLHKAPLPVVQPQPARVAPVEKPPGYKPGGMPWEEWLRFLRQPAPAPEGRGVFNRLLTLIFAP
jgi:hypothetical protein